MKGTIRIKQFIICGLCAFEQQLTGIGIFAPAGNARAMGWVYTQLHGWICPDCVLSYGAKNYERANDLHS